MKKKSWNLLSILLLSLASIVPSVTATVYAAGEDKDVTQAKLSESTEMTLATDDLLEDEPISESVSSGEMAEKNTRTTITGKWGTADMTLDDDGVLTVSNGTISQNLPSGIDRRKDVTAIVFGDNVKAPTDSSRLLMDFYAVTSIKGNLNTEDVTDMSHMCQGLFKLTESPDFLANLNTEKVTNMESMFNGSSRLKQIDLSHFNTSNVTNMKLMFNNCLSVESFDVSGFDTSKVTDMSSMFRYCRMKEIDISNFDMLAVEKTEEMFGNINTNILMFLEKVTLGENCRFPDSVVLPGIENATKYKLPENSGRYTNRWMRTNAGEEPIVYECGGFMNNYDEINYDGSYPGTYEWQETFEVEDKEYYVNEYETKIWNPEDSFIAAVDSKGEKDDIFYDKVTMISKEDNQEVEEIDTTIPGVYDVTYQYKSVVKTATVTIKDDEETTDPGEGASIEPPSMIIPPVKPSTKPGGGSGGSPNYKKEAVWRDYNPNDGDHLFTKYLGEYESAILKGWTPEYIAFYVVDQGAEVYRLYNPNSGEHFYTVDKKEYENVQNAGWKDEGIAFNSLAKEDAQAVPIYRVFNPNATGPGSHHFTKSYVEYQYLVKKGWIDEGIDFYAIEE